MGRKSTLCSGLALACVMVALAAGCSGPPEQGVLQKYFQAVRLRDNTTIANIATVQLDPRTDGMVQSFDVTAVGPEERRTLQLRELAKAYEDAKAAEEEFTKKKQAYQKENLPAIERVLNAERRNVRLAGRDLTLQAEWTKWREETASHSKLVSEARTQLNAERASVETSVFDARDPVNVTEYEGELAGKDVTIAAQVRTPDEQVVPKTLMVRLERATLRRDGQVLEGRWIVTSIKEG